MPALKPQTAARRREQLLDAAMRCFARDGYRRTTVRSIAREAGVTTGAIYAHFEGKEALLTALAKRFEDQRAEAFEAPPPRVSAPTAVSRSVTRLTDSLDTEQADEALHSDIVMLAEALNLPVLRDHLVAADRQHFRAYEEILQRAEHWPRGIEVRTLARVVTGAVFGLLILRAFHPDLDRKKYIRCLRALLEAAAPSQAGAPPRTHSSGG